MPTRGYRKGLSDAKEPATRFVRTRLTEAEYLLLRTDARDRGVTHSRYLRALLAAHVHKQRPELPHRRGLNNEALRQLARIGNNLNQLARQANEGLVAVPAAEIRAALASLEALMRRL